MTLHARDAVAQSAFLTLLASSSWDARGLADAVPPRLSALYAFDPADAAPVANRAHAPRRASYLPRPACGPFRVRG